MKIIPAIDIYNGNCVRLTKGDFDTAKTYALNPVEVAQRFADAGIRHLHIVDLQGAKNKSVSQLHVVEKIAECTELKIQFGGGIRSRQSIDDVLSAGAQQVIVGSMAVTAPEEVTDWLTSYTDNQIIIGADYRGQMIATQGWLEDSELTVDQLIKRYLSAGASTFVCTDISRDGMLAGPAIQSYQRLIQEYEMQLIASGGISSIEDLVQLRSVGCSGAIIGKAIYEGYISLPQLRDLC